MLRPPTLLYYCPLQPGGLCHYAAHQIPALARGSKNVVALGSHHVRKSLGLFANEVSFEVLGEPVSKGGSRLTRGLSLLRSYREHGAALSESIQRNNATFVLMSAFAEYFAPFWIPCLYEAKSRGVKFGAIVHDPIRDFQVGPRLWHQWSISRAYSILDYAFIHNSTKIDTGWPRRDVPCAILPHGPYNVPVPEVAPCKTTLRRELGIPGNARVLLCFGHIRDNKNIDLLLRALESHSEYHVLVAGDVVSKGQKSPSFYKSLADDLGIADRCHWHIGFIPDESVHRYFLASDVAVMLYDQSFRSASGVLNTNAQFRLPVLASSGEGPLRDAVEKYSLGELIAVNSIEAISDALSRIGSTTFMPKWQEYLSDNSWERNSDIIWQRFLNT